MDIHDTPEYDDFLYILTHGNECNRSFLAFGLAHLRRDVENSYGRLGSRIQCCHCQQYIHPLPDRPEPRFHKCAGMREIKSENEK